MSYEHALAWTAAFSLLLLVNLISLVTFVILSLKQVLKSYRDVGLEVLLWADLTFMAALSAFSQAGFRGSFVWFAIAVVWRLAAKGQGLTAWKMVGWGWVGFNSIQLVPAAAIAIQQ